MNKRQRKKIMLNGLNKEEIKQDAKWAEATRPQYRRLELEENAPSWLLRQRPRGRL